MTKWLLVEFQNGKDIWSVEKETQMCAVSMSLIAESVEGKRPPGMGGSSLTRPPLMGVRPQPSLSQADLQARALQLRRYLVSGSWHFLRRFPCLSCLLFFLSFQEAPHTALWPDSAQANC